MPRIFIQTVISVMLVIVLLAIDTVGAKARLDSPRTATELRRGEAAGMFAVFKFETSLISRPTVLYITFATGTENGCFQCSNGTRTHRNAVPVLLR